VVSSPFPFVSALGCVSLQGCVSFWVGCRLVTVLCWISTVSNGTPSMMVVPVHSFSWMLLHWGVSLRRLIPLGVNDILPLVRSLYTAVVP
jgi:hypothetical protein